MTEFAIYIHIPYCLQRCRYCDFATFVEHEIPPTENYLGLLLNEIRQGPSFFTPKKVSSIYFGGGTPSLLSAEQIGKIIAAIEQEGFQRQPDCEVTIEINPATVSHEKLKDYLKLGINRMSVGAQTFNDNQLRKLGRKHSAQDTRMTLDLLSEHRVNFSFDLLFAIPNQTLEELACDLDEVAKIRPHHVSPYCLTVPEGHPLSLNRPGDDEQVSMFQTIDSRLRGMGYERYEISNYAREPRFRSRHNSSYWRDVEYWGLGLSAHSYRKAGEWGERFWNPPTYLAYQTRVQRGERTNLELLKRHEALTDHLHVSLRKAEGVEWDSLSRRFGPLTLGKIQRQAEAYAKKTGWIELNDLGFRLTEAGVWLSNQVFQEFVFLDES